jgi:hypothetical protein
MTIFGGYLNGYKEGWVLVAVTPERVERDAVAVTRHGPCFYFKREK